MSELLEPLSDVSSVRPEEAQFRGNRAQAPSFTELVYAHHSWWKSRQDGTPDPAAAAAYDSVLTAFQARHGQIVSPGDVFDRIHRVTVGFNREHQA